MSEISSTTVLSAICFFLFILLIMRLRRNGSRKKNMHVKYYYSPGCHHCRHFMPVWKEFLSGVEDKATCETINCAETPELCTDITGVPHVTFSSNEKKSVYRGNRTPVDLMNFFEKFGSQ